jgi:hypothetical protein
MANDLTANPIVLDTVSATSLTTRQFAVVKIRWYAPGAAATNAVNITDGAGTSKWRSIATGANYVEESSWDIDAPLVFDGLKVPTLASGTVYLYLKGKVPV